MENQGAVAQAQLRSLADKVAALEEQMAEQEAGYKKARDEAAAAAAALADSVGAAAAPSEMTLRIISEMESRLTKELQEALKVRWELGLRPTERNAITTLAREGVDRAPGNG